MRRVAILRVPQAAAEPVGASDRAAAFPPASVQAEPVETTTVVAQRREPAAARVHDANSGKHRAGWSDDGVVPDAPADARGSIRPHSRTVIGGWVPEGVDRDQDAVRPPESVRANPLPIVEPTTAVQDVDSDDPLDDEYDGQDDEYDGQDDDYDGHDGQ